MNVWSARAEQRAADENEGGRASHTPLPSSYMDAQERKVPTLNYTKGNYLHVGKPQRGHPEYHVNARCRARSLEHPPSRLR